MRTRLHRFVRTMSRLKRRPFLVSRVLVVLLILTEVAGLALALMGEDPGSVLSLSTEGLMRGEAWRLLTFSFSCFAPMSSAIEASLFSSIVLFCLSSAAFVWSLGMVERRYGTLGTAIILGLTMVMHAVISHTAFGHDQVWSPSALIFVVLSTSFFTEFESQSARIDAKDFRLPTFAFAFLLAAVASAFEPAFRTMIAGMASGMVIAMSALVSRRKAETLLVERFGHGAVGGHYYADETQLLSLKDLRVEADKLIEKIGHKGLESLSSEERRFLEKASQRLREVDRANDSSP